jgi:hypothetical protein
VECSDAAPSVGEPKPPLTAWLDDTGAWHKFWSRIRDRSSTDISTIQPRAGQNPAAAADAIGVLLVAMSGGEAPHPTLDTEDQEEEGR